MRRPDCVHFVSTFFALTTRTNGVAFCVAFAASTGCAAPASPAPPAPSPYADDDGGFAVDLPTDDAPASLEPPVVEDAGPPRAAGDPFAPFEIAAAADAASTAPAIDAAPEGGCSSPLAAGDLVIDELMIESVAGTGDYGEWLEVRSTRGCAASLQRLHGECSRGANVFRFDVADPVYIPAGGTFVVADSSDPTLNHDLPGTVIVWAGRHGDVLRNKGATVTLSLDGVMIDSITYPALRPTVGQSLAFSSQCDGGARSDWTRWQTSTASWFPAFFGTPNAPNDDVLCP